MKETKKEIIERARPAEVRAGEEGENVIIGRPVVYDTPTDIGGWFEETIVAGALNDTDLSDVRFCKNHDTNNVYARSKNGKGTLKLTPDDNGLAMEAELDTAGNPLAAAFYSEVSRGDIDGMSFMFAVEEDEWHDLDTDYPKRFIKKIATVVEISGVTFPAYPTTTISARAKEALENARGAAEAARAQKTAEADILALEKEKIKLLSI